MASTQKSAPQLAVGVINQIALEELQPDSGQPRRTFNAGELEALTDSIRSRGVMQPLLVRSLGEGGYMIVDGERRWRAAKAAKIQSVPAILVEAAESLQQLRTDQVVVNELRSRLTPLELGHVLVKLRDEAKLSTNEIAAYLKKNGLPALTKQEVENLIGLTELPDWAQKMVVDGKAEAKHFAALRRFVSMPAVMKAARESLEESIDWGGELTGREVDSAIHQALQEVGVDLTRTSEYERNPVLFDWKTVKDEPFVVQHDGRAYCLDKKKFEELQAAAKSAGLGPGGKKPKAEKASRGEPKQTAAELKEKTEQRKESLKGKATEYLHAYLMRALVPKIDEVAPHLMMFAALKRPNCYDNDWGRRGAPACHYPDGRAEPVEKLGNMKAAQEHKLVALDAVLDKKPTSKAWDAIMHSIALETLFELPFRETLVLAHRVLGDRIEKIWTLDQAFLDLFRNAELRNLAKKHKFPPAEKPFEAMKGSELKAWILASPGHIRDPQILVDLYRKIEKPDRYGSFD